MLEESTRESSQMSTITEQSTKAEIITAATELADSQAATIARLAEQSRILWVGLAISLACHLLF